MKKTIKKTFTLQSIRRVTDDDLRLVTGGEDKIDPPPPPPKGKVFSKVMLDY